ncbi:RbsD/FucU family protein [Paenibacillus lignilyticus]|uniref:Fucose isomerase n=1 Tax=Paenibacillus lignilyticus TaxID=1172615 RepID=A0ABS5C662_9BACL|nr:RbsD/FucU domain-containing protein [Paenibacillus lignilyticus]MBP3961481.1 fucose isomerase [Paenibacillus lignilyticus]
MLYGIPNIISPELLKILMEMGHGDEIVIGDGNYPAASNAQRLVRCDGHNVPEVLNAILQLFPLDQYVEKPVTLMQVVPGDKAETPIWGTFETIIRERTGKSETFEMIERFEFYDRARKAYAIIATSESALYANLILKKGVIA